MKRKRKKIRSAIITNDGAPTKYKKEYDEITFVACKKFGATTKELALLFSVDRSTIVNWKHEHETFFASAQAGRDIYDTDLVERAASSRAVGFDYDEVTKEYEGKKLVRKRIITKKVLPDPKSFTFWLMNRNRERWGDLRKFEGDININAEQTIAFKDLKNLGRKELEELLTILSKTGITDPVD